ncbi:hypothetical protein STXM2123_4390 [Streptomyces sp. F-3]|jgi:hypothetical protein|uniref:Uncharacterized protein n=2 Tax=Streptomyces thermogriseus TaxID=75292 RepID=A0ABN1SXJ0_9ACTN|nr:MULTISPECIES: hypothetical protein [Streptomyces]MDN5382920.1 hypothetical protein [Streptomyces sp. LB8]GAT83689.1 hypothetical protein STXM2123_4390 [Streptomyces sp. F-3]
MSWTGHFHGFGPWVGSPEAYHREGDRRPPYPDPPAPPATDDDKKAREALARYREVAAEFPVSPLPPMMSGHWLMKRGQASHERTWTDAAAAVDWLTKHYLDNPPAGHGDGARQGSELDHKRTYALDVLPGGVDVSWVYYNRAGNIVSINVVCCPNIHHPDLACPLAL